MHHFLHMPSLSPSSPESSFTTTLFICFSVRWVRYIQQEPPGRDGSQSQGVFITPGIANCPDSFWVDKHKLEPSVSGI